VAALALIARLAPAAFTGHGWDLYVWYKTSELFLYEESNIYAHPRIEGFPWGFYAYPPAWLYILAASRLASLKIGSGQNLEILLFKLPVITADILCGLSLWFTARRGGLTGDSAYKAASFYLLNPVTIFISGVWGMFDSIPALFTLLSLYFLMSGRWGVAALSLGVATSLKVYPGIIFPSLIAYRWRSKGSGQDILKLTLLFTLPLLVVSLPYLGDLPSYLDNLTYHRSNIGQFTYWTLLGGFGGEFASTIGWIGLGAALLLTLRRQFRVTERPGSLFSLYATSAALFLAISPKVNVQYLVPFLPLIVLALLELREPAVKREVLKRILILHLAAGTFLAASAMIVGYEPENAGKLNSLDAFKAGVAGFLMLSSAGIAGLEYVKLLLALLGLVSLKGRLDERSGAAVIIIAALVAVTVLPSPAGVRVPADGLRVAVLESPDSLFQAGIDGISQEQYNHLGEPTHIVIPLSPDFYIEFPSLNQQSDITRYFRFRLSTSGWTLSDLSALVGSLRVQGIRVLAGVFTKSRDILVSYGLQGYSSRWFEDHPHLVDERDRIRFGMLIDGNISVSQFYAQRVSSTASALGFDGIYVLTPSEGLATEEDLGWVEPLLIELRHTLDPYKVLIVDGFDPRLGGENIRRLLEKADFIVVKSSNWLRDVASEEPRIDTQFLEHLRRALLDLAPEDSKRVLLRIDLMDFSSGWLVPAIQAQLQLDAYSTLRAGGYSLYYLSRYLPYRVTVVKPSSHMARGY